MNWFERLEQQCEHFAIPHLLRYVAALNGLVFVLCQFKPEYAAVLSLDPKAVLNGEYWRLVSHLFLPSLGGLFPSFIGAAFYLMFLVWLGDGLESVMGAFRLNMYYLLGAIGTTLAAFLSGHGVGAFLLNNSLLFAFAWFFPEMKVYLLFFIPVKVRWLAWFDAIIVLLICVTSSWGFRAGVIAALANYLVFFGPKWISDLRMARETRSRREAFNSATTESADTLHLCHHCGRTEITAPEVEFRVAADGNEYCRDHLPVAR